MRPALKSPADLVVYELHVRDFSISPTSGLKYKGKYLALTEPKAIEYLKNLGINAIHFQPVFDFASIDETRLDKPQFNWGYDPKTIMCRKAVTLPTLILQQPASRSSRRW